MKLYKILFTHSAPKDIKEGMVGYFVANNEEEIYNYIDREFEHGCWEDQNNDENKIYDLYDDDYNLIGQETFKEKIIRIKGEMNDKDYEYCDAYYGITLYGWEEQSNLIDNEKDIRFLVNIGIAQRIID